MSDRQSRREPTLGDTAPPLYESLPHRRRVAEADEGTPWTLINVVTLSVMLAIAAIAGWHYHAHLEVEKATQAYADEFLANWMPEVTAKVEINPLSNFVSIYVEMPPRSDKEQVVNMLVDAIVEGVRINLEPKLDRDLELAARKFFDLYAMVLPYRVSIVVDAAADPNLG